MKSKCEMLLVYAIENNKLNTWCLAFIAIMVCSPSHRHGKRSYLQILMPHQHESRYCCSRICSSWLAIQRRVIIGYPQNASQSLSFRFIWRKHTFWYVANANITNDTAYLLWCFVNVYVWVQREKKSCITRCFKFMYWFALHSIK